MSKNFKHDEFKNMKHKCIDKVIAKNTKDKVCNSIDTLFGQLNIQDGFTFSFHHHLRNGDHVVNLICDKILNDYDTIVNVAATSIFPAHTKLNELVESKRVKNIYTNYINGPVAKSVDKGLLNGYIYMHTHGGRARAIEAGEISIDVAFIAASEADCLGNANGINGKSACGPLGYAIADMYYAKTVVLVCDNIVDNVDYKEIYGEYVDYVLEVDSIGDPSGIVSGTTQITKNPVGLKIARDAKKVIKHSGLLKEGISFQTGAGGVSLAVADQIKKLLVENNFRGSFASGGITSYFVEMLESSLIESIWDVQSFDLKAIESAKNNSNHKIMSASKYGNPYDNPVVNDLDIVVLGATEVDINFNVNVITDSSNNLMGGSGGHSDTAYGAKMTIITTPLIKGRLPVIKDSVTTVTTPGQSIDVVITERGIAVNPLREDLIEKFTKNKLPIKTIEELRDEAYKLCGVPCDVCKSDKIIGYVIYRDGRVIDTLYKTYEN